MNSSQKYFANCLHRKKLEFDGTHQEITLVQDFFGTTCPVHYWNINLWASKSSGQLEKKIFYMHLYCGNWILLLLSLFGIQFQIVLSFSFLDEILEASNKEKMVPTQFTSKFKYFLEHTSWFCKTHWNEFYVSLNVAKIFYVRWHLYICIWQMGPCNKTNILNLETWNLF